ncbi:MAG TPA: 30S ribosomal protein S19 [Sedimentisphaerales bacterium]|nr:30S ribosomal protein S19 [Sedimentisphaerales bacterium]
MGRSLKKGPYVDEKLFAKVSRQNQLGSREPIKTWARRCTITPEFVGFTFMVHNGKMFHKVFVTEDMVGHKLGEFSQTRMFRSHSSRKLTTEKQ